VIGALDETGQEKAGTATAGVQRQYLGCAGKVANGINTVAAHMDWLLELIKLYSGTPHRKVLLCAPDIERQLFRETIAPEYGLTSWLASSTGIDVVVAGDSAPGTWQLMRHDHCKVILGYQGRPDYQGGCNAESGPAGRFNTVCTLDPCHPRQHEAWGSGSEPVMTWPGEDGEPLPGRVTHSGCTILGTS
jgi:hypothetical protein